MKNLFKQIIGFAGIMGYLFVSPALASAASLSFNPATGVFNKGCQVSVNVNLDTQGTQTDGTDVIVTYNPSQLSITTSQITNGTIYPEYPGNSVDAAAGKVSISGISSVSSPFSGSGTFATLKFTVANSLAANAQVNLNFDFDPNNKTKTTDSNIVERGTIADVLSSVTNGVYTVGTGACTGGVGSSATSGSGTGTSALTAGQGQALPGSGTGTSASTSAQYQVYKPQVIDDITGGPAGLTENTLIISAVGVILVVLGAIGLTAIK